MKSVLVLTLFLASLHLNAWQSGPVLSGSPEEREISEVLAELLTTKTGCRLAERFFYLRSKPLQYFFGMNEEAAKVVAVKCPGIDVPGLSLFYLNPETTRAPKSYRLSIGESIKRPSGWTASNNVTDISMPTFDRSILRRILAHEIIVTMDDKFFLKVEGFKSLGSKMEFTPEESCLLDRFLSNAYYQALLSSLRAFRMEWAFADNLEDSGWLHELRRLSFLGSDLALNLEILNREMSESRESIFRLKATYVNTCENQSLNTKALSSDEIERIITRDWFEVKRAFNVMLPDLMRFLIREIALSSENANNWNFGPRPPIGEGVSDHSASPSSSDSAPVQVDPHMNQEGLGNWVKMRKVWGE
jgi:hypothetical protein